MIEQTPVMPVERQVPPKVQAALSYIHSRPEQMSSHETDVYNAALDVLAKYFRED